MSIVDTGNTQENRRLVPHLQPLCFLMQIGGVPDFNQSGNSLNYIALNIPEVD